MLSHRSTKIIAIISVLLFLVTVGVCITAAVLVTRQKEVYMNHEQTRAENEAFAARNSDLTASLEKTQSDRAILEAQMLKDENVIDFLSLIESLGKEQQVTLTTQSLTVEPINDIFETLVVQLEVKGLYGSIMHTLTLFEHLPYQAAITGVQVERQGSDGEDAWKATFTVRVTKFKKHEI